MWSSIRVHVAGGIWLDKGELEKIRQAEADSGPEPEYRDERGHDHGHHDDHDKHGSKHDDSHDKGRKKKRGGGFMDILGGLGGE